MVSVRRSSAILLAVSLALAATGVFAQVAVAAPTKKHAKSQQADNDKGAGHTRLPPGKGAQDPGHGGIPPGQAKKLLEPESPKGRSGEGVHQTKPKSRQGTAGSGATLGSSTDASSHPSSVRGPVRTAGGSLPGQGGSLSGGSPLGGPGWFNFREGREFASDMAARKFRAPVDALLAASRDMAFPIVLALVVVLFLLLQGLMDRRDPKLAVAPLSQNEILSFE